MNNSNDIDLFEDWENLPTELTNLLIEFEDKDNTYDACAKLVNALNEIGYTCEYYLDAQPFNLKKLDVELG